jgi:anti-sigma regulatory factor (Ser/Thr protein kinase)
LRRQVRVFACPEHINLSTNLVETLQFFHDFRRATKAFRKKLTVDLKPIQSISPAGALVLAAEFDAWKTRNGYKKLNAIDADEWDPLVRARLREMGFFELVKAKCHVTDPPVTGDRFLPFLSGEGSKGQAAKELRSSIESLGLKLVDREALYDGLVEAMTNVQHHAYEPGDSVRSWWMSASVDTTSSKLTVLFLDHGVGIPRTLPKSQKWEKIRGFLADRGLDARNDAKLIEAAVSVERSRLNEDHRGNGLKNDIQGYIETHHARGKLRIMSSRGQYVYEKDADGTEIVTTKKLPTPIRGTFIEWVIDDYGTRNGQNN